MGQKSCANGMNENVKINDKNIATTVALVNTDVQLPCNVTPMSMDDSILLIFWYRNEQTIYTVDARHAHIEHFAGKEFASRVIFELNSSPVAFLRLNPVFEEDDGEYRCRVDFKLSRTRNTVIPLKVIVYLHINA
ncbi:sidestep protein-like protein [Leptotrombidium deliense]|uniref:Sidestep protein-like protein n=1 Tax=Leptotrombidium deliense TaxID=299467 RepID=A0A443S3W5_9ACAR|nr:sidestep protein-like protein [Leptotrombidium deliense]